MTSASGCARNQAPTRKSTPGSNRSSQLRYARISPLPSAKPWRMASYMPPVFWRRRAYDAVGGLNPNLKDAGGWKYPNVAQPQVNFARLLRGHILFQEAVFWRRRAYDAVGGLNPNLKVAGDWDLWVRMARRTRFVRRPGHPSCFTLRPDQLSKRMDVYWDEVRERQMAILPTLTARERLGIWWERSSERVRRYLASWRRPDRLFWPIDWREFPPPEMRMPPGLRLPRCPIRGTSPDCLLFSARGQYVYYFGKTHVAGCSQPPGEMVPIPCCG